MIPALLDKVKEARCANTDYPDWWLDKGPNCQIKSIPCAGLSTILILATSR